MCKLAYHICECGAEYKCYSADSECPVLNGQHEYCGPCEQMLAEAHRDELERELERKWAEDEWYRQFNHD